jgi:uncharacterized membrane protein YhaH (DUF805 family)
MRTYLEVIRKYAEFGGRARRKEYWVFTLCHVLVIIALALVEGFLGIAPDSDESLLVTIYGIAVAVPVIAVGMRRMHDTGHRGWWLFVPIFNLLLAVRAGQKGENRYGPDPKGSVAVGVPSSAAIQTQGRRRASGQTPDAFCVRCGTQFPDIAAYCPQCGAARAA